MTKFFSMSVPHLFSYSNGFKRCFRYIFSHTVHYFIQYDNFSDGRRRIDMVLVYHEENEGVMTEIEARRREQRRVFQQNLLKEGLQLELEPKENSFDGKTYFLKLHIPWKIEVQYAEVMNLKLPTKRFITISVKAWVCYFHRN